MDDAPSPYSIPDPKINPARRPAARPDGTPDDNDRVETGPTQLAFDEWARLGLTPPNLEAMRAYRLGRIRAELVRHDYAGILLWDPLNIRYAVDCTNMQVWITHNPARACFIATEGPVVLWDFDRCEHLSSHLPLIDEVRTVTAQFYFLVGPRVEEMSAKFAAEVEDLVRGHGGGNRRLAVDRMEVSGALALQALGIELRSGQEVTELAREIKDANEINAMRCAVAACEAAMAEMQVALRPGVNESELWSHLHAGNIRRGGEWIETRLLSSGPRTNPWYQECGPRVIEDGDLVGFDTDLVGPYGYCADISRTWLCGDGRPKDAQRELYRIAHEHIQANLALIKPGVSFAELTATAHRLPEAYRAQRYTVIGHGVGLCDEYPSLRYPEDYESCGYDGVVRPGMTLCLEAYVGAENGREGVKLEDQVLVTETGTEPISVYPFEAELLN
ncbi:MAG: aminopeptidase P family protein [Alphaproteobacteria bacterium]|nr:aminopeptidase P family protein [Alphaproteobacteria bacterium]